MPRKNAVDLTEMSLLIMFSVTGFGEPGVQATKQVPGGRWARLMPRVPGARIKPKEAA